MVEERSPKARRSGLLFFGFPRQIFAVTPTQVCKTGSRTQFVIQTSAEYGRFFQESHRQGCLFLRQSSRLWWTNTIVLQGQDHGRWRARWIVSEKPEYSSTQFDFAFRSRRGKYKCPTTDRAVVPSGRPLSFNSISIAFRSCSVEPGLSFSTPTPTPTRVPIPFRARYRTLSKTEMGREDCSGCRLDKLVHGCSPCQLDALRCLVGSAGIANSIRGLWLVIT